MNKKVWIGLGIVFLALVLVLVLRMPQQSAVPSLDVEQHKEEFQSQEESNGEESVDQPQVQLDEEPQEGVAQTQEQPQQDAAQETAAETSAQVEKSSTKKEAADKKDISGDSGDQDRMYVTLSVSVQTLLKRKDDIHPEKWELIPEDGWIFEPQKVEFHMGESVFNVLLREMKKNGIHMEFESTPMYDSNYIQGIGNIYEFDCGELSGWMYSVNDMAPSLGTSNYKLEDGDKVRIMYTCDLGRDLGFEFNE